MVQSVASLVTGEGPRIHSQFDDLLSEVIEEHVAEIFHLLVHVALPLETLSRGLRQDVNLDEVFESLEKSQSLEKAGPRY